MVLDCFNFCCINIDMRLSFFVLRSYWEIIMKVLSNVNFILMIISAVAYFGFDYKMFSYAALTLFAVIDTFPSDSVGEWLAK